MRVTRLVFALVLTTLVLLPCAAQQPAAPNAQSATLLQRALAVLSGGNPLSDVTLSGTARRIVGSDDQTGTGVLKALASGAGRTDLSLPSGARTEVQNCLTASPAGTWSGPDGVAHATPFHNLLAAPAWFFPAFVIAQRLSTSGYVATYVGHEMHDGQAVEHVSLSQPIASSPNAATLFLHLSQVEIYLDSITLLPVGLTFNVHPDDDAGLDIPSEIRYSDYRAVNGTQVPFHIQKYVNNTLFLDFQAQTVTLNTGLNASAFSIQ